MVRFKKTPLKLLEMYSFRQFPTTSNHADKVRPSCVISTQYTLSHASTVRVMMQRPHKGVSKETITPTL